MLTGEIIAKKWLMILQNSQNIAKNGLWIFSHIKDVKP